MRKLVPVLALVAALGGWSSIGRADDGEKVTLEGMAQCAKCALKEKDECQNVLIVTRDGQETKYYLAQNELAKSMHTKAGFCSAKKGTGPKVKVVGTCKDQDGKKVGTAETIEKLDPK